MGRIKSQPKRKARTITIVGTAAHAALASSLPEEEVSAVAAIVTPLKDDGAAVITSSSGKKKHGKQRLKKLYADVDAVVESDEELFETLERNDAVKKTKRVRFASDVPGKNSDTIEQRARRQLIFDDEGDNESDEDSRNESNILTVHQVDGFTVISVPSSACKKCTSSFALELMKFHLVKSKLILIEGNGLITDHILEGVTLANANDVKGLLEHCNKSLVDSDDSVDVTSIMNAFEADMLEINLFPRINESNNVYQVDISIHLLQTDFLGTQTINLTPPIPVPRKLPTSKKNNNNNLQKFSKPHSSYILIQALGSIFKGSILENVANSCLTSYKTKTSKITAGMVYSLVDNAHANDYQHPSTSTLDIPGLVPTLRPYQEAAVRWMLERETENSMALSNDEWELCWYVIVSNTVDDSISSQCFTKVSRCNIVSLPEWKKGKSSTDDKHLFCNPFAGWIVHTHEDARCLTLGDREKIHHPMGGILAESMGLGKTVEMIACILANPSRQEIVNNNDPQNQQTAAIDGPLSFHADEAISIYQSKTIIESRATLIVSPASILSQWEREISRHAPNLKVVVYPGIKELCCNSSSSAAQKNVHLVNPRMLADADIVLVAFEVLSSDIGHTDGNPYTGDNGSRLRNKKKHIVLPSPLTSIQWHRVCLDEAQRIETPTSASAQMARKLSTYRRWCISGTPIGRGNLNDLHGLLLFIGLKPFHDKRWFVNSFIGGDIMERLSHLLRRVMWRSTKQNESVRDQMGIPPQEERKVVLDFTSIEKYFYDKQFETAFDSIQRWSAVGRPDRLHLAVNKLRAACCHPQVGAGGIKSRGEKQPGSSSVLSMHEILNKLVHDAKIKCEEALRLVVLHTNGLACTSRLKAELSDSHDTKQKFLHKSFRTYQEAIAVMDKSSEPILFTGNAILAGSHEFRSSGKNVSSDDLKLGWQIKAIQKEKFGEVWSEANFTSPKRVSAVKIRPSNQLPDELQDTASNWVILQPMECILQVSTSEGGGFVDIGSISFDRNDGECDGWKEIKCLRAKKSKTFRVAIKSYQDMNSSVHMESRNFYTGVEVKLFEPNITDDPLQRLHTFHNASNVLSSIIEDTDGSITKLDAMKSEEQSIHDTYLRHAQSVHMQRKKQLQESILVKEKCIKELNNISSSDGSDRQWYEDALSWISIHGSETQQREMCQCVENELSRFYDNFNSLSEVSGLDQILLREGHFPDFENVRGLYAALQIRMRHGKDEDGNLDITNQKRCLQTLLNLSSCPSDGEVLENASCRKCREDWNQTGPVCKHCHLEDALVKAHRLSNDPEIDCVLNTIAKSISDCQSKSTKRYRLYLKSLYDRATKYQELQRAARDEMKAAKAFWKSHFDLLSDLDELNQCKRSMRLQRDDEGISNFSVTESAFVVHPSDIDSMYFDHEAKQTLAYSEMRRSEESLRFLMNQSIEAESYDSKRDIDVCRICLRPSQDVRAVLLCGHSFCTECVNKLISRGGRGAIRCPLRCSVSTDKDKIMLATIKDKEDCSQLCQQIKGNWGTKVNRLVRDVIDMARVGDKGLVLSQWDDMLDIIAEALAKNDVPFIRPHGGKRFGDDMKVFRSSTNCSVLLMNVKKGAEGLTLTEANHCFIVEPILNHSIDSQAINRIHRIGQASKTYVYRYIIANTIEEKIDEIRMEREANHFQEDAIRTSNDQFDAHELAQIFAK